MKKFLCAFVVAALMPAGSLLVHAAGFPERALNLVVPFGPGGSTDLIARALAVEMGKVLGQQIVVLNKAGAGGAIGAAEVAHAKSDGYTLGMLPVGPLSTQPNLHRLSYGPDSFDYVCRVYSNPQVLLVRKDSPYRTIGDLLAAARRSPGTLNYASTGIGSLPHLALAALAKEAGARMVHVPYKGDADSLLGIIGGQVAVFLSHPTLLSTHADSIRGLAVMSSTRLKEYPELPTLAEAGGPALDFEVWGGVVVAKGTPADVLARLEDACRTSTSSEAFGRQLETLKTPVAYMDGRAFGGFVKDEFARNGRLMRESGIEKE